MIYFFFCMFKSKMTTQEFFPFFKFLFKFSNDQPKELELSLSNWLTENSIKDRLF